MVLFTRHHPTEWLKNKFGFEPELHFENYVDMTASETELNPGQDKMKQVYVASVPSGSKDAITRGNYASTKLLTKQLASQMESKLDGGKAFVKPNNTGFVGLFLNEPLRSIMDDFGGTLDGDHQPYTTQPAVVAGIVDALLEAGVQEVHIGENMLWKGGTPRAFFETGYAQYFSQERYHDRVFFVDLFEGDETPLKELPILTSGHDIGDFTQIHPPQAMFDEKYDLFVIASIAKVHNCSWYTLAAKNSSITWNPRKKQGAVYPRWHAHGLPMKVFREEYQNQILGGEFERKFTYKLLGTVELGAQPQEALAAGDNDISGIVITNGFEATAPIRTYPSYGGRVFQVDPHHHAGINLLTTHLGMQYLTNRSYGMFASFTKALRKTGTEVACVCSGVVAQEGEGPLLYGRQKYGGFNVAGFNFTAIERACLDIMFGTDASGFAGFVTRWNERKMSELGFETPNEGIQKDARDPWTLDLLSRLLGEEKDLSKLSIRIQNLGDQLEIKTPKDLYQIRNGDVFTFTDSIYCSLASWLRAMYTEPAIFKNFSRHNKKGVTIPLVPGVVN